MRGDFDSLLTELGSYRSSALVYTIWHSSLEPQGPVWNYHTADAALDQFRRAILDDEVRAAIAQRPAGDVRRSAGGVHRLDRSGPVR